MTGSAGEGDRTDASGSLTRARADSGPRIAAPRLNMGVVAAPLQFQEPHHLPPDGIEARQQLMVVVEHVQLDVRARSGPTAYLVGTYGRVSLTLEDLNRDAHGRVECVI